MKWFLLVATFALLLSSCYRDKAPKPAPGATSCSDSLANDTIHFATQIVPILQTYCTGSSLGNCHQEGSSSGDFTSYEGISRYIIGGELYNRVIVIKDMPSATSLGPTSLTPCEILFIKNWINQGAPDN